MIDFHTHILPEIDDGAKSLEMSIAMLEVSKQEGVKHVCLTPHFIAGEYEINKDDYISKVESLRVNSESLGINVFCGLEVYINPDLPQLYREGKIWGLNNSRYILVELPMQDFPIYTEKVLYQLRLEGAVPVIAHPERNMKIINDRSILENLIEQGTFVQMNSGSLMGRHGSSVKKFAEELVSMNMVHMLGSDAHNSQNRSPLIKGGYEKVKSINPELYNWILTNEDSIVDNIDIELPEIRCVKKKKHHFFNFFKRK
jgi:protein-tyrosine phosphatase